MAPRGGTVVRWEERPTGAVYFLLSTGPTVKRTLAGPFACLTCHRVDCAHARVSADEFDRLCATGQLTSSRFASDADAAA